MKITTDQVENELKKSLIQSAFCSAGITPEHIGSRLRVLIDNEKNPMVSLKAINTVLTVSGALDKDQKEIPPIHINVGGMAWGPDFAIAEMVQQVKNLPLEHKEKLLIELQKQISDERECMFAKEIA